MPLTKEQKKQVINDLKEKLRKQKSAVFVDYRGLSVKDLNSLRKDLKKENIDFKVSKKTLMDLAIKQADFNEVPIKDLDGQIAIAFGYKDEVGPAKHLYKFAKTHKSLKILGGILAGGFVDQDGVMRLAKLPSKQELLAQALATLNAPITGFARVLNGNIINLLNILGRIKQ